MVQEAQQIADDIYNHLAGETNFSSYYVGITNDIERRLFNEHNVPKSNHWRIHREAVNDKHARAVEKHFIDRGMRGGSGGGDNGSIWVYCYKITNYTIE